MSSLVSGRRNVLTDMNCVLFATLSDREADLTEDAATWIG